MPRYLRFIDGRPQEREISLALAGADILHLDWMYQTYATPCPTEGISKVNVFFTTGPSTGASAVLGIAGIHQHFDLDRFQTLTSPEQTAFYLEQLHEALVRCANQYSWNSYIFEAAHRRIVAEDYRFEFLWKKPATSQDRRWKVQARVSAGRTTRIYLLLSTRDHGDPREHFLTEVGTGQGVVEFVLGKVGWRGPETVIVTMENGRDYWTCSLDGVVGFHYPRAADGDPAGTFDLGRMYYEGTYLPTDHERGLSLMRSAAEKGYKHAISYLRRLDRLSAE